jgi:hypothetical protein
MKVLINGEEIDAALPDNATLAATLQAIEDSHVADSEVITSVLVDGEPLTAERLSIWKGRSVDEFDEAEVEIKSRSSFAAEALQLIADRLLESSSQRDQIVELLGRGHSSEAVQMLPGYLQTWDAVQQNLSGSARLMDVEIESLVIFDNSNPSSPQERSVSEQIGLLADQLGQVKSAIEAGDLVLLGDVLDYEFSDLSDTWHNMLLQLAAQFNPQE